MTINEVRIREVKRLDGNLRAIASITIDGCFVVHDIKIFQKDEGYSIAMPNRKTTDGDFKDIAHPLNMETRQLIQTVILEEYERIRNQ